MCTLDLRETGARSRRHTGISHSLTSYSFHFHCSLCHLQEDSDHLHSQPARSRTPMKMTTNWKLGSSAPFLLGALSAVKVASAIPCAAFDGTGTAAYVFGAPYGDLSLGSDLADPSAFVSLTNKTGRPDFSGANTQCFVVSRSSTILLASCIES